MTPQNEETTRWGKIRYGLAALLLGPLGVILAPPLTVAGITLVQMLYVQDFLHNDDHQSATEPSS